ncbi:helix-turn-helix domain-containing protein [Bradyrhizobium sp. LB11.1]|uniref:helix-turn-helix domain-containing protein n=1 Tax=Bradyrhizobium sp. LB11.1 TaxID=3156326 RepID=UPI0033913516
MTNQQRSLSPRWASVAEAARYARLGKTKTWELIQSGKIFAARIGRLVRCDLNSVDELYRSNPVVPPTLSLGFDDGDEHVPNTLSEEPAISINPADLLACLQRAAR